MDATKAAGRTSTTPEKTGRAGLTAELRDAVTPRAALLVTGVLLLQLAFIASYLGAFHAPRPRHVPFAVVAPPGAPDNTAKLTADTLNKISGRPLDARGVATTAQARALIDDREVYGVLLVGGKGADELLVASAGGSSVAQALTTVIRSVEQSEKRQFTVRDLKPAGVGDARGLSAFYLVVGWVVGGYLVAAILGLGAGARPATRRRAVIRVAALAVYSIASGLGGAIIAETVLSALSGHFLALWALGSLVVFAVGAFTMAAQVLLGVLGIGVAILLFVVLGNPSAGGAYPAPMLPPFWAAIGPWLPPGAGTDAARGIVYFGGAGAGRDAIVLAGYAVAGLLITVIAAGLLPSRPEPASGRRRA